MRVIEALKLLEDATRECKDRLINTRQVNEALDLIEQYVDTDWRVRSRRQNLDRHPSAFSLSGDDIEGQQQNLRVHIAGIYWCVRAALSKQIGMLGRLYLQANKDSSIKVEIDPLNAELAKMPQRWDFRGR